MSRQTTMWAGSEETSRDEQRHLPLGTERRRVSRRRRFPAAAYLCAAMLLGVPGVASAGMSEDVAQAFEAVLNALNGTELGPVVIPVAFKPEGYPDSIRATVTVLGFAFCNPPDPWVAPNPTPTPPFNAYGCQNAAGVNAVVTPDTTSADVTVSVSDLFLDLQYTRDAIFLLCPPPGSDQAYLVTSLTITVGLTLNRVGECIQAAIVPGSVQVVLVDKAHGFFNDACLTAAWPLFAGPLIASANENAGAALEALLVGQMTPINEALCEITPVVPSTWGQLKTRYR